MINITIMDISSQPIFYQEANEASDPPSIKLITVCEQNKHLLFLQGNFRLLINFFASTSINCIEFNFQITN